MHIATRKVYMSILTIILVLLTTVATTYAWVGILTYNQIEQFELDLKTVDLEKDYFLSISTTGEDDSFTDSANSDEIKEQILINQGRDLSNLISYDKATNSTAYYNAVNQLFNKEGIKPVTVEKNKLYENDFHELNVSSKNSINSQKSNSFFRFDLYLSVEAKDESNIASVNNNMNIILADIENTLKGTSKPYKIANDFYYPSVENQELTEIRVPFGSVLTSQDIQIDTASATRLAIGVYDPINRTDTYPDSAIPNKTIIYQGGTQNPTVNGNTYSFGGILPEEYNLALHEHKKINGFGNDVLNIPDTLINRGDVELKQSNNMLVDSDAGFGIVGGIKKKIKLTIFFWYEGWDADCFEIINGQNTNINLVFATDQVQDV